MNREELSKDLEGIFEKHGLITIVIGFVYERDDKVITQGCTFARTPSKDHEEEILRTSIGTEVAKLTQRLFENTYPE